jgi:AcrR family transcriptional regulator
MVRRRTTKLNPAQIERRLQIAAARRTRMHNRLLGAAYRLFAVHGSEAPTIDDVVKEANVARGSFYNYFQTRDELFRAVADDMARSINSVITRHLTGMDDPAARISLSFRVFLHFAVSDQARGWILLRTMPLMGPLNAEMKAVIHSEFTEALARKRFKAISAPTAVDIGLGLLIMTIQRLLVEGGGDEHIDRAAEAMLVAMGMPKPEARTIATSRLNFDDFTPVGFGA